MKGAFFILVLLALACRHSDPDQAPAPADAPKADITLQVHNHHWQDINVFMMRGNVRQRLGTVTGASEKSFSIPWARLVGQTGLRLLADPVGQSAVLREDFVAVSPGSVVEWTIEDGLRQSRITVY